MAQAECLVIGGPADGQTINADPNVKYMYPWEGVRPLAGWPVEPVGEIAYGVYEPRIFACVCGRRHTLFVWKGWHNHDGRPAFPVDAKTD